MCAKSSVKKPAKLATMQVCIDTLQIPKKKNKKKYFIDTHTQNFIDNEKYFKEEKKYKTPYIQCDDENVIKKIFSFFFLNKLI